MGLRLSAIAAMLSGAARTPWPISTPMLFEGDSITSWAYGDPPENWAKRALSRAGGRYYLPVSGDFANAGAGISIAHYSTNSMESRQAAVVAKITSMIALSGRCLVWFQIGTNSSGDPTGDVAVLASIVAAYKAAGATVYANTCPNYGVTSSYRDAINAWVTTPGNVNGYVDVNAFIVSGDTGDGTHYNNSGKNKVADAVSTVLTGLITTSDIYTDTLTNILAGDMSGTGGTAGTGSSGSFATGWTAARGSGDGTLVGSKITLGGKPAQRLVLTGGTVNSAFTFTRTDSYSYSLGDVIDTWATVQISSVTDDSTIKYLSLNGAGGGFPGSSQSTSAVGWSASSYAGPSVWRDLPINQAASGSTVTTKFQLQVAPGKTFTIDIADVRGGVRESASAVAPVNTVDPVVTNYTVGQTVAASNGTWTGSPTPTYAQQFYLDTNPISSSYVIQAGDAGHALTVYVTATNIAGSNTQPSAAATIVGGSLSISGTPVTTATQGTAYTGFTVTASGGTSPYTYTVASGSLPAGITLNSSTGVVSGTPTTNGTFASLVIRATDAASAIADLAGFTLTVAANAVPVNSVLPAITGSTYVGQTLTASNGTWTNSPTSFTYQWKRAGSAIGGATASTYVLVSGDVTNNITCDVVAINAAGPSSPATSAAVGPITSTPSWVNGTSSDSVDLDFVNDRYWNGTEYLSFAAWLSGSSSTFTRATTKTYKNVAGAVSSVSSGSPARGDAGLLYEVATTNLDSRSEDASFDTKGATTVTTNTTVAPDGNTTADTLIETATTAQHYCNKTYTVVASTAYVFERLFRAGTVSSVQFVPVATGLTSAFVNFDLTNGTVGSSGGTGITASGIEAYANGFYRCWIAFTPTGTSLTVYSAFNNNNTSGARLASYAGSTGSTLIAWGAQLEAKSTRTSYVPTNAATATRNADALSIVLPTGTHTLTATFDDASTQAVTGLTGTYALSTALNRRLITRITGLRTA